MGKTGGPRPNPKQRAAGGPEAGQRASEAIEPGSLTIGTSLSTEGQRAGPRARLGRERQPAVDGRPLIGRPFNSTASFPFSLCCIFSSPFRRKGVSGSPPSMPSSCAGMRGAGQCKDRKGVRKIESTPFIGSPPAHPSSAGPPTQGDPRRPRRVPGAARRPARSSPTPRARLRHVEIARGRPFIGRP